MRFDSEDELERVLFERCGDWPWRRGCDDWSRDSDDHEFSVESGFLRGFTHLEEFEAVVGDALWEAQ